MNKKIKLTALLLTLPLCAFAGNDIVPLATKGLQVIPLAKMDIPDSIKERIKDRIKQQNEKGYFETDSEYTRFLLNIKHNAPSEIRSFANNDDQTDTHLKKSISQIKLAFPYKGIKDIDSENVIGYAAIGSWQDGWTGIKEFFSDNKMGICSYSLFNMELMHGAMQLNTETTRYDVNNKPTSIDVEGNQHSGFHYSIRWFDNKYNHDLECANMKYDKKISEEMIYLANKIDKQ